VLRTLLATLVLTQARLPTSDRGTLVLPEPVTFATGTATLTPQAAEVLALVKGHLEATASLTTLRIEGHTEAGTPKGQALSEARALAVARALVALGVDCHRLLPVGFGPTKPIAERGNARVDFVNAALRGRPIGGLPLDGGGQAAGDPCAK